MREGQKRNEFKRKWSMHTKLKHHLPVPNQYRGGGLQVKGIRRCGLAIGRRREFILGFSLKTLLGEMSYWDDISPKRSKHELESLVACYRSW